MQAVHESRWELWWIASRPWTYTAAFVPIALGSVLAWTQGAQVRPLLFFLTLLGGVSLQAAANFLNTYGDYVSGVDSKENASCPQLVRGLISPRAMRNAGVSSLALGVLAGLYPVWVVGWPVLICGAIGVVGAACYTTGFFPYKYIGLGSVLVFFLMGPLMVVPAWYIQGGKGVLCPLAASAPIAFLVMAILHGNELRDIEFDRKTGISTLAMRLGLGRSIILYKSLFVGAYLSLFTLVLCSWLSVYALLPFILLPLIIKRLLQLHLQSSPELIRWLAKQTGKMHFLFGGLLILGQAFSLLL